MQQSFKPFACNRRYSFSPPVRRQKSIRNYLVIISAASIFACGGGGGNDSNSQNSASDSSSGFCSPGYQSYEDLSENGFGCRSESSSSSGTVAESPEPSGNRTANIDDYEEYEPNNEPENANMVAFPIVSGDTLAGIEITGVVQDTSDDSDYFILSPNQGGSYAVYLCGDTCTEHPTDSVAAIRVFDQFGDLIAGNPLYEESTKILTAELDAGIPYYVQILGFDTQSREYPYRLVIIE